MLWGLDLVGGCSSCPVRRANAADMANVRNGYIGVSMIARLCLAAFRKIWCWRKEGAIRLIMPIAWISSRVLIGAF